MDEYQGEEDDEIGNLPGFMADYRNFKPPDSLESQEEEKTT
jgi:hypothetical protein